MKIQTLTLGLLLVQLSLSSCQNQIQEKQKPVKDSTERINQSTDSLLTKIQSQTFEYFWEAAEPTSGLARERVHIDGVYPQNDQNVITIGGSGFGIMGMVVAIERGFISKEEGTERLAKIMDYLKKIERFEGAWSHWYFGDTGKVKAFSEKDNGGDIVETAFLAQALIVVREYFKAGNNQQKIVAKAADNLWKV